MPWLCVALSSMSTAQDGGGAFNLLPQQNPIMLEAEVSLSSSSAGILVGQLNLINTLPPPRRQGPRTGQKIHSIEKPSCMQPTATAQAH